MTSSQMQKRNVAISGVVVIALYILVAVLTSITYVTTTEYEPYAGGYKLIKYAQAFYDSTTEYKIPARYNGKAVLAIETKAFYDCDKLVEITMPDTVVEMGSSVFKDCDNLERVRLSESLINMGGACFENCKSLRTVSLPDSLETLRGETFRNCKSLVSVKLPKNITEIRGNTFEECSSLKSIEIPDGVIRIAAHSFEGCSSLTEVYIPQRVNTIGSSAFRRCTKLSYASIDENTQMESNSFKESPTLIDIRYAWEDYEDYENDNDEMAFDPTPVDDVKTPLTAYSTYPALYYLEDFEENMELVVSTVKSSPVWQEVTPGEEIELFEKKQQEGVERVWFFLDCRKLEELDAAPGEKVEYGLGSKYFGSIIGIDYTMEDVLTCYRKGLFAFENAEEKYLENKED